MVESSYRYEYPVDGQVEVEQTEEYVQFKIDVQSEKPFCRLTVYKGKQPIAALSEPKSGQGIRVRLSADSASNR